jgi:oligoendopeptidase F
MDNPASSDLGSLPQWNLGDLYESPKAPGIDSDPPGRRRTKELAKRVQGKLADLDGEELAEAVKAYEALQDVLGKVGATPSSSMPAI